MNSDARPISESPEAVAGAPGLAGPALGEAPSTTGRQLRRVLILCAVLAGAVSVVHFSPLKTWLADTDRVRQALGSLGIWAYPVCGLGVALLVSCGVPRLLLCVAGGAVLGFWSGLFTVLAGTLLGHYAAFLFIRWGGREWVLHRWPKLSKWADLVHEQGILGVVLVRQLPIHGTLVNLCLGFSHVKHRHFLIGTAIGLLPEAIGATLVGTGLVKATLQDSATYLVIAVAAFSAFWIACGYLLRAMRNGGSWFV